MVTTASFEAVGVSVIIPFTQSLLGLDSVTGVSKNFQLFDNLLTKYVSEEHKVLAYCLIFLAIFLLKNIFIYLTQVMGIYLQNSIRRYCSASVLEKYLYAEYDFIVSEKRGTLINNIINEPWIASKFVGRAIAFVSKLLIAIFIYTTLLVVNWRMTFFLTIIYGVIMGSFWLMSKKVATRIGNERLILLQQLTTYGEQALNAIRQVKLFNIEVSILKDYDKKFRSFRNLLVKFGIYNSIPIPLGEILVVLGFVSVLIYINYVGGTSIKGMLPIVAFTVIAAGKLYQQLGVLVQSRLYFQAYSPAVKLINEVMRRNEIKEENLTAGRQINGLNDDIVLKGVSFAYPRAQKLFSDFNLRIEKGKTTAIVGKSGAGKSTLIDLLCGLHKEYDGRIMIGSIELKELKLENWRRMIGYVSQDVFLFNTTVSENIRIGNKNANENEMIAASQAAHAHNFIMNMPEGYDTVLGDRGLKISGGQRQRITIARALVRKPEVLILDEATSSLDTESESQVRDSIEHFGEKKTTIIISHRLSSIKNADYIYVLGDGKIVESGTYEDLSNIKGYFNDFVFQGDKISPDRFEYK